MTPPMKSEKLTCANRWDEEIPLTEEWLAEVGFKYQEPRERQPWRHWILKFRDKDDDELYIETTMPGWLNRYGEHIAKDSGWFLWIGRDHKFLHLRHIFYRSDIIAIVEALSGAKWNPENHNYGIVGAKR